MPATPFTVGLVQMRCSADPRRNLAAAEDGIREAAKKGAQVVCLPELFRSLYFCQSEDHAQFELAEAVPGPTTQSTGIPANPRQGGVWIMNAGSSAAHLMTPGS